MLVTSLEGVHLKDSSKFFFFENNSLLTTKAKGTHLAAKLLEMWSWGQLSSPAVAELAAAAVLDGNLNECLQYLAKCNKHGHAHRAIRSRFTKKISLPDLGP